MPFSEFRTLTVADDATTSDYVFVADFVRGSLGPMPTGWVTAAVTLQVSNDEDDPTTWNTVVDEAGSAKAAISGVAAGDILRIETDVFSYRWFRLSLSAAQTGGPLEVPIQLVSDV